MKEYLTFVTRSDLQVCEEPNCLILEIHSGALWTSVKVKYLRFLLDKGVLNNELDV